MLSVAVSLFLLLDHTIQVKAECLLHQQGVMGYVQKADIHIGGVFPLHLNPGTKQETFTEPPGLESCKQFSFRSFRWILAFLFAVEEVNRTPGALTNLTLGAAVMDSCSDATISYFAPPAKLSNHFLFPSTLSVAPTVSSQAKGLARLLQAFSWSWVGVLTQETSASTLGQTFIEELKTTGACLAFWEKVPSSVKDVSHVADIIRQSTARVVVVFSLEAYLNPVLVELARNGDSKDRIWLSTDAWSTSPRLVDPWLSHFLKGSLGLVLRNGAAPGFSKFVFDLNPKQFNNHPLFLEFWEEAFSCRWPPEENHLSLLLPNNIYPEPSATLVNISSASNASNVASSFTNMSLSNVAFTSPSPSSTKPFCTGLEDTASLQIFSDIGDLRVTYNVYKAVKMISKALQDMTTCQNMGRTLELKNCVDLQHFQPWQLLHYLWRVRLKGNIGDDLYFDSLGNAPAVYDIINQQEEPTGKTSWVKVGSYESGAMIGQDLFINKSAIQWGDHFDQPPASVCSENCPSGFRKTPHRDKAHCCFDCMPCPSGAISNQTNAIDCFYCPENQWPNIARNRCIPRMVELLTFSEPLGISLGTTSIFGSIIPALVLLLFIKNRETPLVRANNWVLSFILLVALTFSFLCPLLLLAPPGKQICFFQQTTFGVTFTLCISCLLAKTFIVVLAFRANNPSGCLKVPKGVRWPILFAIYCTAVQLVICLSWCLVNPPFPEYDTTSVLGKILIQCNYNIGFWFMLGYLGLLSTVCFVVAFLARKLPGAFNEATHITFSMLVFLSVWITFVPTYISAHGKLAVATEMFAILSSSAGLLFCIFSPKVYIILLQPQLNTRIVISGHQKRQTKNIPVLPPLGRTNSKRYN
ncbi:extracellular calcium-sensing receptor-like [Pyxicephalus adspersus]|uniref:extracellular calcium-sensing receptor-like n=1 Tax=Pyxicephalus adspersus TaxID=30357 RepID=UPI003B59B2B5